MKQANASLRSAGFDMFPFDSYDEPIEPESDFSAAGSEEGLGHEREDF